MPSVINQLENIAKRSSSRALSIDSESNSTQTSLKVARMLSTRALKQKIFLTHSYRVQNLKAVVGYLT